MIFRFSLFLISIVWCASLCAQPETQSDSIIQVDNIIFEGNKRTKTSFLLEVIVLESGKAQSKSINDSLLTESINRLNRSLLFKTVSFRVDTLSPIGNLVTRINVTFELSERWYIWPYPVLELVDPNFNIWWKDKDFSRIRFGLATRIENINGAGDKLYVKGVFGFSKEFRLSYSKFTRRKWGFSYGVSYVQYPQLEISNIDAVREFKRRTPDIIKERYAATIGASKQLSARKSLGLSVSAYQSIARDSLLDYNNDYFGVAGKSKLNVVYLSSFFANDSRDYVAFPFSGRYFSLQAQLPIFDGLEPKLVVSADFRKYYDLKHGIFSFQVQGQGVLNAGGNTPYEFTQSFRLYRVPRLFDLYVPNSVQWIQQRNQYLFLIFRKKTIHTNFIPMDQFKHPFVTLAVGPFIDQVYFVNGNENGGIYNKWLKSAGLSVQLSSYYDKVVRVEAGYNSLGDFGVFLHFTKAL